MTVDLRGLLARPLTAAGFLTAVHSTIGTAPEVALFSVDHESQNLVPFDDGLASVPIDAPLFRVIADRTTGRIGGATWVPLPDRYRTLLIARMSGEPTNLDPWVCDLIGQLYAHHRTSRFALEQPRRTRNMSIAAELQWQCLPPKVDGSDDFALAAALKPAYDVAGDAFDFALNDSSCSGYAYDAMGHGLTATLSATLALTAVRNRRRSNGGLVDQVTTAHETLLAEWGGDRFVTMVAVHATVEGIEVVNAGHEALRRRKADGSVETLRLAPGPPLGVKHDQPYKLHSVDPLDQGEAIVFLSDGAPDNRSVDLRTLGEDGVNEILETSWAAEPFEWVHHFLQRVNDYLGCDPGDDITAMVLARR